MLELVGANWTGNAHQLDMRQEIWRYERVEDQHFHGRDESDQWTMIRLMSGWDWTGAASEFEKVNDFIESVCVHMGARDQLSSGEETIYLPVEAVIVRLFPHMTLPWDDPEEDEEERLRFWFIYLAAQDFKINAEHPPPLTHIEVPMHQGALYRSAVGGLTKYRNTSPHHAVLLIIDSVLAQPEDEE